jgi:hypothetical protein
VIRNRKSRDASPGFLFEWGDPLLADGQQLRKKSGDSLPNHRFENQNQPQLADSKNYSPLLIM